MRRRSRTLHTLLFSSQNILSRTNFQKSRHLVHRTRPRQAKETPPIINKHKMGNGRKSAVELLRSLQDLLACDGCGVAFVASGNDDTEEEDMEQQLAANPSRSTVGITFAARVESARRRPGKGSTRRRVQRRRRRKKTEEDDARNASPRRILPRKRKRNTR